MNFIPSLKIEMERKGATLEGSGRAEDPGLSASEGSG